MPRARGEFYTTATVGAASELRACAELMRRGYQVYRCESPSAPFDLVAHKDGKLWKVEVKTLTEPVGTYAPSFPWPTNDDWDVLAVVAEEKFFFFDADVSMTEARNSVRAAYGFGPSKKPSGRPVCGNVAAYNLHLKRGELPCEPCGAAHRAHFLAKREKGTRFRQRAKVRAGQEPTAALPLGWVGTEGCTAHDDGVHRKLARRACSCGWRP